MASTAMMTAALSATAHRTIFSEKMSSLDCAFGNLSLHASADGGAHWRPAGGPLYAGSSGYSDMARTPGGALAVAFERDRHRHISVSVLPLPAVS